MTSPLLALFTRSLREDTRAKGSYWARAGLATFLLLGMAINALFINSGDDARGLSFLANAIWVQTIFLTISGLAWFASAITEEKEEEMLGLLRMTNLSPLSILLGKSTNRLCGALLLIATQIPFTLIAVTLGGVSMEQVLAAYVALGAYAFVFCNLALLCSVLAPRTGLATLTTIGVMLVMWLAGAASTVFGGIFWRGALELSPFHQYDRIFATGFAGPVMGTQAWLSIGCGVLLFLVAWALFERFCDHQQSSGVNTGGAMRRRVRSAFSPGRAKLRNPVGWKDFYFLHGGWGMALVKFGGGLVALLALLAFVHISGSLGSGHEIFQPETGLMIIGAGILWLILEAGFVASRVCSCEVRDRTLSSLALLPQSLETTLARKVPAGWAALFPALTFIALGIVYVVVAMVFTRRMASEMGAILVVSGIVGGYVFALSYLGVFLAANLSLRMKRGAYPLAIIICLALCVFALIPVLGWYGVPVVAAVYGHNLRTKMLVRLEEIAAED
jgi:hypothetical protein